MARPPLAFLPLDLPPARWQTFRFAARTVFQPGDRLVLDDVTGKGYRLPRRRRRRR